jgi:hypothetical protein
VADFRCFTVLSFQDSEHMLRRQNPFPSSSEKRAQNKELISVTGLGPVSGKLSPFHLKTKIVNSL